MALHAKRVHPELELTPEVVEQAKGVIRTSQRAPAVADGGVDVQRPLDERR